MLYIVGTPIGNIKDISIRAQEVLENADLIIAESIPDTKKLLSVLGITAKNIIKFNDRNKQEVIKGLIHKIKNSNVAFVTSAGMPGVSDPGGELVEACYKHDLDVEPIPGPSALSTAIAMSGFTAKRFTFIGFLPRKKSRINKLLSQFLVEDSLVVFFESPFRILKSLQYIESILPQTHVFLGREMTKKFQTYIQGDIQTVIETLQDKSNIIKGEFTIVLKVKNNGA